MKYKDYLSNYVKNDDSIYPGLKGMKDGKINYIYIRLFVPVKNLQKERKWLLNFLG